MTDAVSRTGVSFNEPFRKEASTQNAKERKGRNREIRKGQGGVSAERREATDRLSVGRRAWSGTRARSKVRAKRKRSATLLNGTDVAGVRSMQNAKTVPGTMPGVVRRLQGMAVAECKTRTGPCCFGWHAQCKTQKSCHSRAAIPPLQGPDGRVTIPIPITRVIDSLLNYFFFLFP